MFHRESKDPIFGASHVLAHTIISGIKIIIFSIKKTIYPYNLEAFKMHTKTPRLCSARNITQDLGVPQLPQAWLGYPHLIYQTPLSPKPGRILIPPEKWYAEEHGIGSASNTRDW